jgi:alpha-ketoglutarate-dependent taurine dioxygenase
MSTIEVRPLDATLGAVVTGSRLAQLDDAGWRQVEAAFHEHAVLVFPGQHLSREEQTAFGRRFGELEFIVEGSGVVPISNRDRDGSLRDAGDPVMKILEGNQGWHTDSSYMPVSAKASMLSAHVLPSHGGETEWADTRDAYDTLDDETKDRIAGLAAYHSIHVSQAKVGQTEGYAGYGSDVAEPPLRPLVKVHPVTGRPALYIGRHAYGVPGLDPAQSEQLLDELLAHACRAPRTYQHRWQVGDLVVWDNRCVLHRARPWDLSEARVMHHTRVAGDPRTESSSAATPRTAPASA